MPFSQSPLGRGHRTDGPAINYSQFSKSHSDLHARALGEFPSPAKKPVDLPPMPIAPANLIAKSKQSGDHLQSPTNNLGFSRSVDDLVRDNSPDPRNNSSSNKNNSASHDNTGTWGEMGLPQDNWGRASDIGTMANLRKDQLSPSGSFGHGGGGQVPFSSTPSYQASPSLRNTAWPQEAMLVSSQHLAAPSTSVKKRPSASSLVSSPPNSTQSITTTKSLAPGVEFEGFLNRNANINLPLSQLTKGKEKDIGKGWKPYKVLVREGKLFFYKPGGAIADEVKTLFPTTLVAAEPQSADLSINLHDISKGKLGTQELLAATSRGTSDQAPPPRLSSKRGQNDRLSAIADDQEDETPVITVSRKEWERRGKHEDLVLMDKEAPGDWSSRIHSGSLEALSHEYVFATQMGGEEETSAFLYTCLVATVRSSSVLQFVQEACKWTSVALTISKDDEMFQDQDYSNFCNQLEKRIILLIESDVVNLMSKRAELLAALEKLIAVTWKHNDSQAEAQLAKILALEPAAMDQDRHNHQIDTAWSALRPSALLQLDPAEIARQIHIFTVGRYDSLHLPASSILRLLRHDKEDCLRLLSFDWSQPHFLTRLVLDHVLQSSGSLEGGLQHSAKLRASLLRHWIAVASFLLKLDNVAAWLSICGALCSRSIARLSASWRFVASNDRSLLAEVWAPILLQMGWSEVEVAGSPSIKPFLSAATTIKSSMSSRQHARQDDGLSTRLPYLGSSLVAALSAASTRSNDGAILTFATFAPLAVEILELTKQWQARSTGQIRANEVTGPNAEIQRTLQSLCARNAERAEPFDSLHMLKLSLQLESPWLGKVDVQPALPMTKSLIACSQSPLIFPESLPTLSLLEREGIEHLISSSGNTVEQEQRHADTRRSPTTHLTTASFPFDMDATVTNRTAGRRSSLATSSFARTKSHSSRTREMPYSSHCIDWASPSASSPSSDEGLFRIGSDLLLCAAPELGPAQSSSPLLIKRYSQEMGVGSRPVSQVSKRSSLPASNRSSFAEMPTTLLHTFVKAGTLDRLVDVLVMGLDHVTLDTSDDSLERTFVFAKRSRLTLDLAAYRKSFLATYRSFCQPLALFEHLQKRFSGAVNASRELGLPLQHRNAFPTWSSNESMTSQNLPVDWEMVTKIRSGVTSILASWVSRYSQDFAENDGLYRAVLAWAAKLTALPHLDADEDWHRSVASVGELCQQVQLDVMTCCIRQVEKRALKRSSKRASTRVEGLSLSSTAGEQSRKATINFDEASPVELVEYLETVARVFFEKIEEKDFLMTSELFQTRANDPMAWFIAKNSSSALASQHPDEMPQVNNMYKLLELIRWPRDGPTLSQRLATSIRDACAAQNLLRGWIAIHIVETKIGVVRRQARLEKLLDAVWICRARMMNSRGEDTTQPASAFREPTVASFVECIIVGSLTSSESKLFVRAWQGVAAKRQGNCDNLLSLYPPAAQAEAYAKTTTAVCTPDIGWIMRTMAEAMTKSSTKATVEGEASLVEFDRYETIWAMIESSVSYYSTTKNNAIDPDLVELAGARLTAMQNELRNVTWERRAFKEDAALEASSASPLGAAPSGLMRGHRPLTEISTFQQDKHRRDRRALEVLDFVQHQRRSQQAAAAAKATKAAATANQAPQSRSYSSPPQTMLNSVLAPVASASEKKTRRMTALFRGAVRPINLMGSGEKTSTSAEQVSHTIPELLSCTPTQKPSLVVSCGSSQVKIWTNHQRSFVFHLSVAEGGSLVLQATSHKEVQDWITVIEKASKVYALPSPTADASRRGGKKAAATLPLYGSSLKSLVEHERRPVPLGLLRMLEEIEARGLREQGIYRISGAKNTIEALKSTFNRQPAESVELSHGEFSDIHTIAGAIKQWYRDLPEPAVPFAFYHRIIEAEQISNEEDRLYAIRDLIWDFPKAHFDLLRRTSQHLALVCDEGKYNLMAPHNIGLVFGTSLLNPPPGPSSVAESFGNIGKAAHIVKIIVTMHEWLFEPEPEAEVEADIEGEGEIEDETVVLGQAAAQAAPGAVASSDALAEPESNEGIGEEETMMPPPSLSPQKLTSQQASKETASPNSFRLGVPSRGGGGGGSAAAARGERGGVESVYLDATDAIAALQDPFEEEEEGGEEDEKDV